MLLLLTMVILSSLVFSNSPLKLSLSLASISTLLSLYSYQLTSSIFIPCAMIISFSSGMMILFSYCSMLSLHESKNNMSPSTLVLLMALIAPLLSSNPVNMPETLKSMMILTPMTSLLIFLMTIVIISMVCINTTFFNPTKKFMQSY